jgi:hypothetical protein
MIRARIITSLAISALVIILLTLLVIAEMHDARMKQALIDAAEAISASRAQTVIDNRNLFKQDSWCLDANSVIEVFAIDIQNRQNWYSGESTISGGKVIMKVKSYSGRGEKVKVELGDSLCYMTFIPEPEESPLPYHASTWHVLITQRNYQ